MFVKVHKVQDLNNIYIYKKKRFPFFKLLQQAGGWKIRRR